MTFQFIFMLFVLYAIQGIPYGIQSRFLPVYLRSQSFSLTALGLLKLLYIPWMLKTFYAPIIDLTLTKVTWLKISVLLLLLNSIFFSSISCHSTPLLLAGLFSFNLLSAAQDISLDGIMIAQLTDSQLSIGNIAQVVGYKCGAIIGGGFLILLSAFFDWQFLFLIVSLIYLSGFLSIFFLHDHMKCKSSPDSHGNPLQLSSISYRNLFETCLKTRGTKIVCLLVLIHKMGEQGAMNLFPLFLFDSGASLNDIGLCTGIIGQLVSIAGSSLAALFIRIKGLSKTLYLLSVVSVPVHLVFMLVIYTYSNGSAISFYFSIIMVNLLLFISGIRTTATFSIMMKCSQLAPVSIQATHYTFLATLEVLGKLTFSSFVGIFADYFGYFYSYGLFFVLSVSLLSFLQFYREEMFSIEQSRSNENHK